MCIRYCKYEQRDQLIHKNLRSGQLAILVYLPRGTLAKWKQIHKFRLVLFINYLLIPAHEVRNEDTRNVLRAILITDSIMNYIEHTLLTIFTTQQKNACH